MTRRHTAEHGQVLILALVALILVLVSVLLLFDVQTVIRGKVKVQNAVDAAALTGAEWQKNTLNLIGELNLVRAAGTLISDPFFGLGANPESFTAMPPPETFRDEEGRVNYALLLPEILRVEFEKRRLSNLNALVSQLQTRVSFVGPLIGFGAAQQAAKNNGLNYNRDAGEVFQKFMDMVYNDNLYGNNVIAPQVINNYAWRWPYISMLQSVLDFSLGGANGEGDTPYGIAASTKIRFIGMPSLGADPPNEFTRYLGNKDFYDAIHGRNWCELKELLDLDFNGAWWGSFSCDFNETFSEQSELLPVHIEFSSETSPYTEACDTGALQRLLSSKEKPFTDTFDREDPYPYTVTDDIVTTGEETQGNKHIIHFTDTITITLSGDSFYNDADADLRYDLLPLLSWAIFDGEWERYSDEVKNDWRQYLRGNFKEGTDYYSGAISFFEAEQDTVTLSGTMGPPGKSHSERTVGSVFTSKDNSGAALRMSSAQYRLRDGSINRIESDAEAKPIGTLKNEAGETLRPFEAGRMVLPAFTQTALIPISLEPASGFSTLDLDWYYFLTEFVPLLANSPTLDDAWQKAVEQHPEHLGYYAYYYRALVLIDNPAFRQQGKSWLDAPASWAVDKDGNRYPTSYNKDHCDDWPSGGGGTRFGPDSLH